MWLLNSLRGILHIRNGSSVFPEHMLRRRRATKLDLRIQVFHHSFFGFGNLLNVHQVLERLHQRWILAQKWIRAGVDTGSIDTHTTVIDVPLWECDRER